VKTLILTVLLIAALPCAGLAQSGYQINWSSINSGGGVVTGGNYGINSSIGQSVAGFVSSTANLHWVGFWAGDMPAPTIVASANEAKLLPDGTFVSVAGKIATSAHGDFDGFFYIEEETRTSGIRVAAASGAMGGLLRGHVVNVIGTLGTTASGERQFTGPVVIVVGSRTPLTPLGMPNASVGGGDFGTPPLGQYGVNGGFGANNVGLLIQTWGRVVATWPGCVQIDDGSGPVTVDTSNLASPPGQDTYVTVIGISSLYKPGSDRLRLLLPRGDSDVRVYSLLSQ
jgi:hypothetical protein